jgi:tetratricopeptide (TPR) repeat protein
MRVFTDLGGARHPSRPLLALSEDRRILLIDLTAPNALELAYRPGMARLNSHWQRKQAEEHTKARNWFSAAFHWEQLAHHDPGQVLYWVRLAKVCTRLGDYPRCLAVCEQLLSQDPTLAPVYFWRARMRAHLLQFHDATADNLIGLALVQSNPAGWPEFAGGAREEGEEEAYKKNWFEACQAFGDAALWERQEAWHLQRLAWAHLAGGHEQAHEDTCRYLFDHYRTTGDVDAFYRQTAELGLGLAPGPSLLRGLAQPVAEAVLKQMQRSRNTAIVYTVSLVPNFGLPAVPLVKLAQENVQMERSASHLQTLGAAQYRAGQYADARKSLEEALALEDRRGTITTWTRLFLAMTYARMDEAEAARSWFDSAKLTDTDGWETRLIHDRLRAEAKRLLGKEK